MKYLQPSFTFYMNTPIGKNPFTPNVKPIDPKHKYTDVGGMCRFCALNKQGHLAKGYGK